MTNGNALDSAIVETSLRNMFRKGHFDICAIRQIIEVTKILPRKGLLDRLALLHCIDFDSMPAEVLDALPGMIREVLSGINFDFEAVFQPPQRAPEAIVIDATATGEPPKSRLLRLFSR